MPRHREEVEQSRANVLKAIRAAIRLKHSIEADNEINDVLPEAEAVFNKAANTGRILSLSDVKRAIGAK